MFSVHRLVWAAVPLFTAVATVAAQAPSSDVAITTKVTADSGQFGGVGSITTRMQVSGHQLRVQIDQGTANPVLAGMYIVFNEADSTSTMVLASQRMAMITGSLRAMGVAPPFKMAVTDAKTQVEDLGPGERLLGHDTHRYRLTESGTLHITVADDSCSRPIANVSEVWIAPGAEDLTVMFNKRLLGITASATDMDWTKQLEQAAPNMPKGMALRTIGKATSTVGGKLMVVTNTIEVTELSDAPIDPKIFGIPDGFNTMDTRSMMAGAFAGGAPPMKVPPPLLAKMCGGG